jgi:acetyl-CoA synthetase
MAAGNWIWQPSAAWIEQTNVFRFMQKLGFTDREEFLAFSREQPEAFWDAMVKEVGIEWFEPYTAVQDCSRGPEWCRWFLNGKINIAWNCLDRHDRAAIACLWEGEDGATRTVAFGDLQDESNRLAHALRSLGLVEGDRIALSMPMVPEVLTILYASLKLGLIVVPIFAGFGPGAIATRLADSGARVLFTADCLERRAHRIPLKEKVDQALQRGSAVERVVVLPYRGASVPWTGGRDMRWDDLLSGMPATPMCERLDSESPAFILYTSGTTGKPKGTVHTHAGCLAQMTKEIWLAFDHKPADRFFWLSDIGWMMGPWTIIGNHHFGGTIFLYDGAPDCPTPDRLWQVVERHAITTLGISPTAIRLLMRSSKPERHEMPSLRLLGSTGEPWDETSYTWFFEKIGKSRCPVINISGGTEIVGSFLFPLPIQALKPCSLGGPAPGMATDVFDEHGAPVRGRMGYLVCTRPSPSMTRGVWGDPERYLSAYWSRWNGVWYHGDWASVDEDGCWFVHGRADESMNVAGRKVGPAEVEAALIEHPAVSEAAVIGVPDDLKGEAIVCFAVLKHGYEANAALRNELANQVVDVLGATFRPKAVLTVAELPKTQSGKIVRRLIRQRYLGESLGDVSTVENPSALEQFALGPDRS